MFKRLNSDDIVVGSFPIVEPAGTDFGGILVNGTDYETKSIDLSGAEDGAQRAYRQIANIIQGDSTAELPGSPNKAIAFIRNSFKESIYPQSFSIGGVGIDSGSLNFVEGGRQFPSTTGNYYLYPDVGIVTINGTIGTIVGCSEETTTFTNVFVRIDPSEFNYSTNPSFSDIDGNLRFADFIDNPRTYITTIGFYNDNGDCLAVAKVDKPTENRFEQALLFKVEMKF